MHRFSLGLTLRSSCNLLPWLSVSRPAADGFCNWYSVFPAVDVNWFRHVDWLFSMWWEVRSEICSGVFSQVLPEGSRGFVVVMQRGIFSSSIWAGGQPGPILCVWVVRWLIISELCSVNKLRWVSNKSVSHFDQINPYWLFQASPWRGLFIYFAVSLSIC